MEAPQLTTGTGSFCVQRQQMEFVPILIIGGCVLITVVNIVLWTILLKKQRAAKKAQKAQQTSQAGDESEEPEKTEETLK